VQIQHGPATVIGDESRNVGHCPPEDGKAAASRTTRKSGYHKGAWLRRGSITPMSTLRSFAGRSWLSLRAEGPFLAKDGLFSYSGSRS